MNKRLIRKLLAEFVGTCFLVMIVIGSGIMAQNLSSDQLTILLANTIATGAGLTALIWIFISISGAHFNPAVSLIMFLKKELTLKEFSCIILYEIHKEHCQISADQLKNNKRQYKVWVYSGKSIAESPSKSYCWICKRCRRSKPISS